MSRKIAGNYAERVRDGWIMHNKTYVKLLFVKNGVLVDREELYKDNKKNGNNKKMFGHFKKDMGVIFPRRIFNLNYRSERIDMITYLSNLEAINEAYEMTNTGINISIVCKSLSYKKYKSSPLFQQITGKNLEKLTSICDKIREREA